MPLRFPLPRFHGWVAVLAVVCGLTVGVAAQPAPAVSPVAGVRETTLPNGLKLLTKEVHSAPVVAFQVWYRVGSRNEHTGITGTSHLLEHLMFKGTKRYGLGEISRTLFVNGATFNAGTSFDYTNYWETLAADRIELAMQIESDRMTNSRIDKEDLASEMTVVRSELEGGENDPARLLAFAVAAAAFETHPYQWPTIGWRTDVENVPRDTIYEYYRKHYGPNNATIVAVGDFETEKVVEMVRRYFGKIPRIPDPPPVYTQEPPQRGERRVTVRRAGSLPMVSVAFRSPEAKSPDFYALDAMAAVLATGRTSRMVQDLVEKQLASDVIAGAPSLIDPFLFSFDATAAPGVPADRLETALLEEVERLKTQPVTAPELNRAKAQIEADFVLRNDSVTAQAQQIGYWANATGDWRYLATYVDRIKALTPGDIQRVAQKYFVTEARTIGQFIPTSDGGSAAPPPRESSARVEKPRRGDKPVPLPKPLRAGTASRSVSRFKLENGVSVVVQENHSNPSVALRGSLPAGSVFEPADQHGLAALTAGMLRRGTTRHSALQLAAALEDVGASVAFTADTLNLNLQAAAQSRDLDRVLDLVTEMLREPTFPADQLDRVKVQQMAALAQEAQSPAGLANRAFLRSVYAEASPLRPPHPRGSPGGTHPDHSGRHRAVLPAAVRAGPDDPRDLW